MGSPGFSRASRLSLLFGALAWLAPAAAAAAHYEADEGEELMRAFAFEEENLAEFARHRSSPAPFYRSNKVRRQERRKGGGERKEERGARGASPPRGWGSFLFFFFLPPLGSGGEWELRVRGARVNSWWRFGKKRRRCRLRLV